MTEVSILLLIWANKGLVCLYALNSHSIVGVEVWLTLKVTKINKEVQAAKRIRRIGKFHTFFTLLIFSATKNKNIFPIFQLQTELLHHCGFSAPHLWPAGHHHSSRLEVGSRKQMRLWEGVFQLDKVEHSAADPAATAGYSESCWQLEGQIYRAAVGRELIQTRLTTLSLNHTLHLSPKTNFSPC